MDNKLFNKIVIYGIGNLGGKLITFLLLPVYAYFLNKKELGIYDLFMTTLSLLVPIAGMQLGDSAYRWILDAKDRLEIISAISNSAILFTVFTFLSLVVGLLILLFFPISYGGLFLAVLVLQSVFYYLQQVIRGLGETKLFSFLGVLNTFLLLIFSLIVLSLGGDQLKNIICSYILTYTVVVIFALFRIDVVCFFDFNFLKKKVMFEQINYAFPLVSNMVSWWLINFGSKYVILFFMGAENNGIFAVSTRVAAILMVVNSVYMLAIQDVMMGDVKRKSNEVFDGDILAYNGFIRFELYVIAYLTIFSPFFVKIFFSEVYFEAWKYIPILMLSVAFSAFSAYVGLGYQLFKKTWSIFITTLVGGAVSLLSSVIFVRFYGLYAIAVSAVLGFLIVYLIRMFLLKEVFNLRLNFKSILLLLALNFLIYFLVFFYMDNFLVISIVFIVFTALVFFVERDGFLGLVRLRYLKS